jgi:hypothetical protein
MRRDVDNGNSAGVRVWGIFDIWLPRNESLAVALFLCLCGLGVFWFSVFLVEGALVLLRFANATLWNERNWVSDGIGVYTTPMIQQADI